MQVPQSKLDLNMNLPGMKGFALGMEKKKRAEGVDENADGSSSDENDSTDSDVEMSDAAPFDFIPLNIDNKETKKSNDTAEPNSFFAIDAEPSPVNLNGKSIKSKKRAKGDDGEENKTAKKVKKEKSPILTPTSEPEPASASNPIHRGARADNPVIFSQSEPEQASTSHVKSKTPNVDFSAIEAQLQAEIEAGTKAKEEREKAKAEKLAKKAKKRKRLSEGDSEKEVKKPKNEIKERNVEGSGDEAVLTD